MLQQFRIAPLRSRGRSVRVETQRASSSALLNNFFQSDECATTDKQNIGGIDRRKFLVRMLTSTLRRNVSHGAFQNLEQGLLHAFATHIARNRRVLVLFSDLVDLIYIDDALLSLLYVEIGAFQNLEQGLLHAFATHIARNRRVLVLFSDLVDLIYIDDALLSLLYV